jgi:1A family penicillin-binding protein
VKTVRFIHLWAQHRLARGRLFLQRIADFRRTHPHLIRKIELSVGSVFLLLCLALGGYLTSLQRDLPDSKALEQLGEMDQATRVFDGRDHFAFTIFKEQRIEVPLAQVSPNAINAVLAIEDQRFYKHHGFDWIRTGAAALTNLRHLRFAQGASTLTQQLARMSFLTPERTVRRKLQELMLALRIEHTFRKDEILELYLNKAYFGDGLYGIEAASRGYFGKSAHDLTPAEGALLAGLVKSPSTYAPTVKMQRAVARRNVVLSAMKDADMLGAADYESARHTPVVLHDTLRGDDPTGMYFKEQIRQELVERLGWQRVYQGGLRVYATIDMDMQRAADAAVAEHLRKLDERRAALLKQKSLPADPEPLQAALVALEPSTGHVLAMVGGRDFEASRFNRAVQAKRQPGSAFKPFVYATALESGYAPATVLRNLSAPIATLQGAYTPDDEHLEGDAISLRAALRTSSNRAAVRLLQQVGIGRTVRYAKAMGLGDLPSVPSLALGAGETTVLSMTAAYAGFANNGDVPAPMLIRRVEDADGRTLYTARESTTHAISPTTAYLMSNMLADVINAGTGAGARSAGFTLPAAGKTGTTNDFHDAWFVGYTPSLVTAVWVGFDQPKTILPRGFAADIAVPMWTRFMKDATKDAAPDWFKAPPGIVGLQVCRLSGQLAAEACLQADAAARASGSRPIVYTDYFVHGTEPTGYCQEHATAGLVGSVATVFSGSERPSVPHLASPPPPPTAAAGQPERRVQPQPVAAPDAPKKRGFWSRVFRVGGDKKANDSKER